MKYLRGSDNKIPGWLLLFIFVFMVKHFNLGYFSLLSRVSRQLTPFIFLGEPKKLIGRWTVSPVQNI
jgi:hypothetical protein